MENTFGYTLVASINPEDLVSTIRQWSDVPQSCIQIVNHSNGTNDLWIANEYIDWRASREAGSIVAKDDSNNLRYGEHSRR